MNLETPARTPPAGLDAAAILSPCEPVGITPRIQTESIYNRLVSGPPLSAVFEFRRRISSGIMISTIISESHEVIRIEVGLLEWKD